MKIQSAHPRFDKLDPSLRHRILDAALGEFGRFGYGGASMNRLVRAAGISKGALFKYFGTKAGLFAYVYRASINEVKKLLREVRESSSNDDFFLRLEKVLRSGLDFTRSHPLSAAIYYRVIYTGDAPHGGSLLTEIQGTSRRFLLGLIRDGVAAGELRPDLDAGRTAFIVQSVLDRFLQAQYLEFMSPAPVKEKGGVDGPGTPDGGDEWIVAIVELLRNGLERGKE